MRATIKDVAKAAGVSTATVSNVLTNKKYVSPERRAKIHTVMEELGYKPNTIARSLKVKRTFRIGIMVPDITNPFFGEIVESAERAANKENFQITLCNSGENIQKEKKILDTFLETGVDGIINVAPRMSNKQLDKSIGVPMVIVDRPHFITKRNVAFVYADNEKGGEMVAQRLAENGYKDFLCFAGPVEDVPNARKRLDGFKGGLKKQGFGEECCKIFYCDFSFESGFQKMMDFLNRGKLTKRYGAFISSDIMAWGAMEALKTKGYKIPRDIGIVGYDNIYFSKFLYPGLTTVENPTKDLGTISTSLLLEAIANDRKMEGRYIVLGSTMIVRQSE